ncbi:hypothetical protein BZL29_7847 [Mycobacterium kansasii]|uniref:Uncharacterized protein n=1 Tax=Mycobacterium kansasii TaxID=1768 RepID=A0A1V3WEB2_MYCKA|nr:hypothetical protein BZL29_7847 [Mycobacterium kansasii]
MENEAMSTPSDFFSQDDAPRPDQPTQDQRYPSGQPRTRTAARSTPGPTAGQGNVCGGRRIRPSRDLLAAARRHISR